MSQRNVVGRVRAAEVVYGPGHELALRVLRTLLVKTTAVAARHNEENGDENEDGR